LRTTLSVTLGVTVIALTTGRAGAHTPERHAAMGVVLDVDRETKTVVISHQDIPGLMAAMTMPFNVRDVKELAAARVDSMVDFTLVVANNVSWIEDIHAHVPGGSSQPAAVPRLQLIDRLLAHEPPPAPLAAGDAVPDFTLTDQAGRAVRLSDLKGKVVAVSFMYSRCRLPDFCLRMSNNLGALQKRFVSDLGEDVVLLTLTFDPTNDTPEVLGEYAKKWNADASSWHFLTGPLAEVQRVCRGFGVNVWPDGGMLTHSLRTIVIDREGKVAASLEGNEFSAKQLGDVVESVQRRQTAGAPIRPSSPPGTDRP
jgi:protein SCO1/2